ncbi:MAG: hypothetical protein QM534_18585 [Sediminibacterium sp.]|nr:hypothetical protein [Sediminibacterium sp.]
MKKLLLINRTFCFGFTFFLITHFVVGQTPQTQTVTGSLGNSSIGTKTTVTAPLADPPKKSKTRRKKKTGTAPVTVSPNLSDNETKLDSIKAAKNKTKGLGGK